MKLLLILSVLTSIASAEYVQGYFRADGTYVQGYYRSEANGIKEDNYSYPGNSNPYQYPSANKALNDSRYRYRR